VLLVPYNLQSLPRRVKPSSRRDESFSGYPEPSFRSLQVKPDAPLGVRKQPAAAQTFVSLGPQHGVVKPQRTMVGTPGTRWNAACEALLAVAWSGGSARKQREDQTTRGPGLGDSLGTSRSSIPHTDTSM